LKLVCLVLSLLLWSKAWRHCKAYDTNYEWWESNSVGHPIFMVILCLWYIRPNDLNLHWRRCLSVLPCGCSHDVTNVDAIMGRETRVNIL
jgi:hypothetical protein